MGGILTSLVFQPPGRKSSEPLPNKITLKKQERQVFLSTERGENVHLLHINKGARLRLVYSHGNAEDMLCALSYFRIFAETMGVDIFLYDYVGYGSSSGLPSEKGIFESAEAVLRFLIFEENIDPKCIVLYGRSLGSGPSVHLALYEPQVGGLIIQSGLLSIHRVVMDIRKSTPCDIFKNNEKICKVKAPTLIIHGTDDEIVPLQHGLELYRRCPGRVCPLWISGGRHNNLESYAGELFYEKVKQFLIFVEDRLEKI